MNPAAQRRTSASLLAASLTAELEHARRAHLGGRNAVSEPRLRATIERLFMLVCAEGSPHNLYTRTGIPRTHNAWEMQYLLDEGLLFFLYSRCAELVRSSSSSVALAAEIAELVAELDTSSPERLARRARAHYRENVAEFLLRRRALQIADFELATLHFECAVLLAYIRLAVIAEDAIIGFDLFPAHTGPENVVEGLKGLVSANVTEAMHHRARRFFCCRAESYTRYYGQNLARELAAQRGANRLRFSLVVPFANGVRHIALTRCWPIDGAEHTARYVAEVQRAWAELARVCEVEPKPPKILVTGYSQGGATVRLLDEALRRVDVLARPYFRDSVPRGVRRRCRTLARIITGDATEHWRAPIYTVSIATMGGIDGVGFAERFPELRELAADQRGAAGVRSHKNPHDGLHLGICHDFDPARWIVPAPLVKGGRRRRAGARKLNLVRILLKFGGPNLVFHGGVWTHDTEQVFASNPPAKALIDDVLASLVSAEFVDEAEYFDDRCLRAAFPHLVVGTVGYPGWVVVEKFGLALRELSRQSDAEPTPELLRESSWRFDILPDEHRYDDVVAAARRFHELQRREAARVLARLEARAEASTELLVALRERVTGARDRAHVLRRR